MPGKKAKPTISGSLGISDERTEQLLEVVHKEIFTPKTSTSIQNIINACESKVEAGFACYAYGQMAAHLEELIKRLP